MRVDFQPAGRRVEVAEGTALIDAARLAGIELVAVCGGGGTCGTCKVRLVSGRLSPVNAEEEALLQAPEREAGLRLACQAVPLVDVQIEVPPGSLSTPQRSQLEGLEVETPLDPPVIGLDIDLEAPDAGDLRSDADRLRAALAQQGLAALEIELPVLEELSGQLRSLTWKVRCAVDRSLDPARLVTVLPQGIPLIGLAVDVGTTKLAAYLVELSSGRTIARLGAMNPQIAYGDDVVSRIAYCNQHEEGRKTLQNLLISRLNEMLDTLCAEVGLAAGQVVAAAMVGNTAMHHLLLGLPVRQLGAAPFVPAASGALDIPAYALGLKIAPGARVYLPPNIAGYVGADHVAMLLGTEAWKAQGCVLAMDIGTNTEITLAANGRLYACSCASGPAFEGAHILHGMRAAPGAIEKVQLRGDRTLLHTVGGQLPVGLCGSGILDAVAEMLGAGLIDTNGALDRSQPGVRGQGRKTEYVLVSARASGSKADITVTREDINQIQLAKAAIRAGVEVLLRQAGIHADEVEEFIIAGAFGTYLDLHNAMRIGMFPRQPMNRFRQVGNAAGTGARQLVVSRQKRAQANEAAQKIRYVELTTYPGFTDLFVQSMYFR